MALTNPKAGTAQQAAQAATPTPTTLAPVLSAIVSSSVMRALPGLARLAALFAGAWRPWNLSNRPDFHFVVATLVERGATSAKPVGRTAWASERRSVAVKVIEPSWAITSRRARPDHADRSCERATCARPAANTGAGRTARSTGEVGCGLCELLGVQAGHLAVERPTAELEPSVGEGRNIARSAPVEGDMTQGHTITTHAEQVQVEVRLDGETVATTDHPVLLEETGLPTRYYLPRQAATVDLQATTFTTHCPFKGDASYWSIDAGGQVHDGVAWSYETPKPGAEEIASHLCFTPDRVEILVDGAPA